MQLQLKPNVMVIWTTTNLTIAEAFCRACREVVGTDYIPTLTAGMDGTHSLESGHYYGRALDFRNIDLPGHMHGKIQAWVSDILGPKYLCLVEGNHFHIQRQKDSF